MQQLAVQGDTKHPHPAERRNASTEVREILLRDKLGRARRYDLMDTKELLERLAVDGDIVSQIADIVERKRAVVGVVYVISGMVDATEADTCSILLGTLFHSVNILVVRTECGQESGGYDARKDKETVQGRLPRMISEADWLPVDLEPLRCGAEEACARLDTIRSHIAEWYVESFFALKLPKEMGKTSFAQDAVLEKMKDEVEALRLKIETQEALLKQGCQQVEEHIKCLAAEHEAACEETEELTLKLAEKQEQKKALGTKIEKAKLVLDQQYRAAVVAINGLKKEHEKAQKREASYLRAFTGGWEQMKGKLPKMIQTDHNRTAMGKPSNEAPKKSINPPKQLTKSPLKPKGASQLSSSKCSCRME